MTSALDKEAKVGAMLRHMSGDVGVSFKRILDDLYSDEKGEFTDVGRSCAKWHWVVVKYSENPAQMRGYISLIQHAFEYEINLDNSKEWKKLMRIILPEEFISKMKSFTQVPQIAIMDETPYGQTVEIRETGDVDW